MHAQVGDDAEVPDGRSFLASTLLEKEEQAFELGLTFRPR